MDQLPVFLHALLDQTGVIHFSMGNPVMILVGAMTDFGPMIANPKLVILGAGAHPGIFVALTGQWRFLSP